jgi:hypothetical protein
MNRKWHAVIGNIVGLSVLELVDDALHELEELDLSRGAAPAFEALKRLEEQEYKAIKGREPTGYYERIIRRGSGDQALIDDEVKVLLRHMFHTRPYCHTARLPSAARHAGILTETHHKVGSLHYDRGIPMDSAQREIVEGDNSTRMRLVYDASMRQDCSYLLHVDYKDYFYVGEAEGEKSLVLPNYAEIRAYDYKIGQLPLVGLVGFATPFCERHTCPKESLLESGLDDGEWEMTINGARVTGHVKASVAVASGDVTFVRHKEGWHFPPNDEGRFEVRVRVTAVGKIVRFSSFIIF